jgi:HNH endonuclease
VSTTHISAELRRTVRARSGLICEYCLIHEEDTFFGLEVDHIIAEKHGGETHLENLCCACLTCNRFKGSDIATLDANTRDLVRLFHPRQDVWSEHFELEGARILGTTKIGEATVRLLRLNLEERLLEREMLLTLGRYPANPS